MSHVPSTNNRKRRTVLVRCYAFVFQPSTFDQTLLIGDAGAGAGAVNHVVRPTADGWRNGGAVVRFLGVLEKKGTSSIVSRGGVVLTARRWSRGSVLCTYACRLKGWGRLDLIAAFMSFVRTN